MDDPTLGERDRFPMPGYCTRGRRHFETRVYRYGTVETPTFLCRTCLVALIKVATWPAPPRNLGEH